MRIETNCSLLPWNTFGIDVRAAVFAEYESVEELRTLLSRYKGERLLHVGRGSNLLFTGDFEGVVLHSRIMGIERLSSPAVSSDEVLLRVGAGVVFDDLVSYTVEQGWGGLENLSYIPGEVGAAAVQNIGAYGVEVQDLIRRVFTIDVQTLEEHILTVDECAYAYRDSVFKNRLQGRVIVTAVEFALPTSPVLCLDYGRLREALSDVPNPSVSDVRRIVIAVRKSKLPEVGELGSAGSFFKNPVISEACFRRLQERWPALPHYEAPEGVKLPAAWLIEQCGWKGRTLGGAQVYEKQPLVIVNRGNARPDDIVALADAVRQSVYDTFGVHISPEVNYI